jgi:hypothetical protein
MNSQPTTIRLDKTDGLRETTVVRVLEHGNILTIFFVMDRDLG